MINKLFFSTFLLKSPYETKLQSFKGKFFLRVQLSKINNLEIKIN